jgi:hypothetical protein
MMVVDENFPIEIVTQLARLKFRFKQIGSELANAGVKDDFIITVLHSLKNPTFFTLDDDFYKPRLCHSGYCLVFLKTPHPEIVHFLSMFIKHPRFNTKVRRMGKVIQITTTKTRFWTLNAQDCVDVAW